MVKPLALRPRARPMHPHAEPNVIPFIDVLLVLLIIFMVTAPKPTTDLRVDLPRPNVSATPPMIEPTIVELRTAPGGYGVFIGARQISEADIGADALAHILAANPALDRDTAHAEARVFVRADLDVAYAPVVGVVEALQQARFAKVAIIAQNADE
jgi:biopolymer transport protein ExbD